MKIYHGSKKIIEKPIYQGSNPENDYGPSFYMTLDLEAAKVWACKNDSLGIVNVFNIDKRTFDSLKILDLTDKSKYSVFNWLAILMHFRRLGSLFKEQNKYALEWLSKYYIDVNQYDIVIGYRADDNYFKFPIRFINGQLSFEDLENVFLSGDLGIQYAFVSKRSLEVLHFDSIVECEEEYLGRYYEVIKNANRFVEGVVTTAIDPSKTYIMDVLRKDNER